MHRLSLAALILSTALIGACKEKTAPVAAAPAKITDLAVLAAAVPTGGPREGNNYKVFFKTLRQNQAPAVGFRVDAWVKGKSEPRSKVTDENGIVIFEDLPFPDAKSQLNTVLHYATNKGDDAREIAYPYIESDAYRLKDTQYIPNNATPDPQ